jgi:hypothetical protein
MQITLKNIENYKPINKIESTNNINNFSISTINTISTKKNHKDITYFIEENVKKFEILEIKKFISSKIFVEKELISIFKIQEANLSNDLKELPDDLNILEKEKNFTFFYKINKDISFIKINIEYFTEIIGNFYINIPTCCSIYMLKANLAEKLRISLSLIKLINIKNNKHYDNNDLISSVYNHYLNYNENISEINIRSSVDSSLDSNSDSGSENLNNNNEADMCMKLIKFSDLKCSIGIDFTFNHMEEIKKVNFQESAPYYREASDGINIFAYCKNKKCRIFNEMFIVKIGKLEIKLINHIEI